MRLTLPLLLLCLMAVPSVEAGEKPGPPKGATEMATSINKFGLDLYRAVGGAGGNLFFSPYSVSAALGMTREGAAGETAAEMDKVFHYPGSQAAMQKALASALTPSMVREYDGNKMRKVPAYALSVANALWGQEGFAFKPTFTGSLKNDFGAPLYRLDFKQVTVARKTINDWVAKHTKDKIKDIVPVGMPPPDTRLTLANAIYFKANWLEKFNKRATKKAPWYRADGTEGEAELMNRVDSYGYMEDDDVQVAELPYKGRDLSMLVILPKAKQGLVAVEKKLDHERLSTWVGGLRYRRVNLKVPKFKFTTSLDLSRTLSSMGMPLAFNAGKADFSGMTAEEPLFIGAVLHKAFVAVDEEGTEAAAATVVMMRAGSMPPSDPPIAFTADHPFIFAIRHKATGAILFMGRIADPAAE